MEKTVTTQVLVIGAGLAGLSAAVRLAQSGIEATVIEAGTEESYLCASRYTGGLFHIAMEDMLAPEATVLQNLRKATSDTSSPELAQALASNARRTLDWLKSLGVRFISAGQEGFRRNSLSPPGMRQTGTQGPNGQPYWLGRSGDTLLRLLADHLRKAGGRLERGVRARQLRMEGGRCIGALAQNATESVEFRCLAVVIADGGFQSNHDLLRRFGISAHPDRLLQRNAQSGQGDGIRMAEEVGAKLVGTDSFYGHMCYRDAISDERFWPYPIIDSICTAGIVIDGRGQRFCDEGRGGIYIANQVAKLDDPLGCATVFDSAIWDGPGRDWVLPPNPYLLGAGAELMTATTLAELALQLGVDRAALEATVAAHNAAISQQSAVASPLMPPRTTTSYKPWPVLKAPFHALPAVVGVTYTMGGIATDGQARVLKDDDTPFKGLYAAGACTGGLEGGGFAGYSGGLSKASVFGVLAAEHIAGEMQGNKA